MYILPRYSVSFSCDNECELCVRNNNHILLKMRQLSKSKSKQKRSKGGDDCIRFEYILSKRLCSIQFYVLCSHVVLAYCAPIMYPIVMNLETRTLHEMYEDV